ncbi:MAG: dienelactone hydrolase family protein [Deltaproteobacteria bacterium]|nr:MAG: dienelactone hydrolase family protein [Deltaproteobacteria bacterium]
MKETKLRILIIIGLFLLSCGDEESVYEPEELPIGVVTITLNDESRQKEITTEIWYPAVADPEANAEIYEGVIQGIAVREAEPESKYAPYPLLVFSHGLGGFRNQSVYLTESLASRGFVVIAPDHSDALKGLDVEDLELILNYLADRPPDISFLIDEVLARSVGNDVILKGLVDESRIGMMGHSLGGYTSVVVAGANSDYEDQRVIAAVPLAPFSLIFTPEKIGQIDIPMMVIGGTKDTTCPFETDQRPLYQALSPPKYLLEIFEAGHMVFSDAACITMPDLTECQWAEEIQGIVVSYTTAFFCCYLKGKDSFLNELQEKTTDDYELSTEQELDLKG